MEKSTLTLAFLVAFLVVISGISHIALCLLQPTPFSGINVCCSCYWNLYWLAGFSNEIEAARNTKEVASLPSFRALEGQKKPQLVPMEGGGCIFWWDCSKICPPGCDVGVCDRGHCRCTCTWTNRYLSNFLWSKDDRKFH